MNLYDRIQNDLGYHKATDVTGPMHEAVRARFKELALWVATNTPPAESNPWHSLHYKRRQCGRTQQSRST